MKNTNHNIPEKRFFLGGGGATYKLQDVIVIHIWGNEYPKTLMHITKTGSKYM